MDKGNYNQSMKRAFCLINHLIVSFCLIFSGQVIPTIALAQTESTSDTVLDAEKAACAKNTAYEWSASLNRCIQKKQAQADRHEAEDCAALTDVEQRKACHKRSAEKTTGLSSDVGSLPSGGTNQSTFGNTVASAYALIGILNSAGTTGKTSNCISKKIFAVTAFAGLATDLWLKAKAKNAMDELKDKYQLGVKNNAYDNQSKAFEYLKTEQQTVKEVASQEKKRNMLLTLGYGAALSMALYEISPIGQNPDCYIKANTSPRPAAPAAATNTTSAATSGATGAAKQVAGEGVLAKIGNYFNSPQGIIVAAGIGTIYSGILYSAAAKQEDEADQNVKKIDRILAEFKDSFVAFCPEGRDDLSKPECYCYLAKGGKNPDRTKSQICQTLWAKNEFKNSAVAGDYTGLGKFKDPVGCLTIDGQFDEACKCKKFLDSKGNNACQKGVSVTVPVGLVSTFDSNSGIKEVLQFATNAGNGNPMLNNFKIASLATKAIATNKLKDHMLTKLAPNLPTDVLKLAQINGKNVDQYAKAFFGEKNIADAVANSKSALDVSAPSQAEGKVAESLKAAATKAGLDFSGSGKGLANKKIENKEAFTFNLGGDAGGQAAGAGQLQDFPEQQKVYKVKGDISKRTDTSIFEIISNRYIQSGLKRLFDE